MGAQVYAITALHLQQHLHTCFQLIRA